MARRNKILLIVFAIFISLIAFLSFGFQTSNFNDLIQKKFNDQYKKVKLEFKDIMKIETANKQLWFNFQKTKYSFKV